MKPTSSRIAVLLILVLACLAPSLALRPAHLPQTVGIQFLQGLQLKDFEYVRERVLPDQLPQLALFESLATAAGWVPSVNQRGDFPLLGLVAETAGVTATYALGDKGSVAVALVNVSGDWFVDLANTRYIDGSQSTAAQGSLKVSRLKPIERARAFLEAFIKLDLIQAASFGTDATKAALIALQPVIGLVGRGSGESAEAEIKMMSEKIDGDSAVVEYRIGSKPTKPLVLVRQGGNWMVDLAPGQSLP